MSPRARLVLSPLVLTLAVACGSAPHASPPAPAPAPRATAPVARAAPASSDTPGEEESPVPITRSDPTWGARTALVTIVEFSDFQCPFCARAVPTLEKLRQTYGPAELRIVWKHMPLSNHVHARPAAEAAQVAFALGGNEAFWRFHAKAYSGAELPDTFDGWAGALGVDPARYRAALASHQGAAVVDDDVALAGKLHVEGTPHFFVNGIALGGAQPFEKFTQVIDEAIVQAKAAVDRGVPREYLYLVASSFNVKNAPAEQDDAEPSTDDKAAWRMPVGKSPVLGPATAAVTIVEFSDFQCPFCGRADKTLAELRKAYGDRIRIVWKNEPLPFHPRAEPAAQLALEARLEKGDAGFWDAHDRLFADQTKLEESDLLELARAMHLDVAKVTQAIKTHKHKAQIDADSDLADEMNAGGTPYFFINGRRLVGAQPAERFRTIIDEEEAKAKALVARGTAPAAVYDELQKQAEPPAGQEKKQVTMDAHAPSRGTPGAPVIIQEFADFQCPFCGRAEETMKEIQKSYAGKVRLVWRNLPLPFHQDAELAAEAAMEAYTQGGNGGFWQMHDKLLANQGKPDGLKRPALEQYAGEIGMDAAKFGKALDSKAHKEAIEKDARVAEAAQIVGTPAFVINGYFVSGAESYARFRRVIDRALGEATAARR